jgi:hypothetical protein
MNDTFNVTIPEGSELRRIVERLITELWISGWLDSTSTRKIIDAEKKRSL